jgi:hypothetical protein
MIITRYTVIRALVAWLWVVAIASGIGGGVGAYYAADGIGGAGQTLLSIVGAIAAATPFLAIIAFLNLAVEVAQGVTWITAFLHDHDPGELDG